MACYWAIKTGLEMGIQNVIIEGDSLTVIKKCRDKLPDKSEIRAYIQYIQIQSAHVNREANRIAHVLATEGLIMRKGMYLKGRLPDFLRERTAAGWIHETD